MSQDDINKDLGDYIKEKHKCTPFWERFKKKDHKEEQQAKPEEATEPQDHEVIKEEPPQEVEIDEPQPKQEGSFKRMFKWFGSSKDDEEVAEQPEKVEDQDAEMKEFLKAMHSWITKLEPSVQKEFKNSPDFETYTNMLRKHGLIK